MHINLLIFLSISYYAIFPPTPASFVGFEIKNAGLSVQGKFSRYEIIGKSSFTNAPEKASVKGEIQVHSILTGIKKRDSELMKKAYFDEENFPKIKFWSTKITRISDNEVEISGILEIKGVEKTIVGRWKYMKDEHGFEGWAAEIPLKRSDFGVGGKSWILSDDLMAYIRIPSSTR